VSHQIPWHNPANDLHKLKSSKKNLQKLFVYTDNQAVKNILTQLKKAM